MDARAMDRKSNKVAGPRVAGPFGLAAACAAAMLVLVPAGFEAETLFSERNDPVAVADHMLDHTLDAAVAQREITQALDAGDAGLAQSFLDLAQDRRVPVDAGLAARVATANGAAASATHAAGSFARGLVTGEPADAAGLAGTAVGDLFVFGDIRDAVREGSRLATGQPADELILGLAGVGIAITAGTYATAGIGAPVRIGLSLAKAARATGRMSIHMGEWLGRSLRDVLDWGALARAIGGTTFTGPVVAVRAAREAIKVEKTEELFRFAGDIGRVEGKAGTQAALDGLKLAEGPRDMSRIAKVAETYGSKTRAVLKLGGRAAIWLTISTFHLMGFMLAAVMNLFGFCAACKRTVERATERYCRRRKARMLRLQLAQAQRALQVAIESQSEVGEGALRLAA
jgi:hypothetical protein